MRDEQGYDEFFADVIGDAVGVAERVLGNRDAAEDAAVEALARAHLRWRILRNDPHKKARVLRAAINAAIDIERSDQRRRIREQKVLQVTPIAYDHLVVDRLILSDALRHLPTRQRDAIVLRYLADLPQEEVASTMGVSSSSIQVHLRRGLQALGQSLADEVTGGADNVDAGT
jgi:RNA polymerase sigma factor (sigma-70 family)